MPDTPTPDTTIKLTFPSLAKLLEYAASPISDRKGAADTDWRSSHSPEMKDSWDNKGGWYGSETFADAIKLASDGWPGPRAEVVRLTDQVIDHVQRYTMPNFVPVFDVSGGEVDVDRFLLGEPENMIEQALMPVAKHGKVVRLIVAGTVSCGISQETINQRGAAVVSLIDALRLAQHTLEIWVHYGVSTYGGREWHCVALLKAAEDALDIDGLMFALAHPSMLRRVVFSVMEHEKPAIRKEFHFHTHGGYGSVISRIPTWITADDDRPFDVVVDSSATQNIDRSAEQWLDGVLKGLGIVKEEG
jgi:hypothetical protein